MIFFSPSRQCRKNLYSLARVLIFSLDFFIFLFFYSVKDELTLSLHQYIYLSYDKKSMWLFPFIMGDCDRWTLDRYQAVLCRYNSLLKVLAALAGVKKTVTSYVSRHSWASIANELSISTPIVSRALGHTNSKTTQIYISEINMKLVEEANGQVLKKVIASPLNKRR